VTSSETTAAAPLAETTTPNDHCTQVCFELPDLLIEAAGCVGVNPSPTDAAPRLNTPRASVSPPASARAAGTPTRRGFFVPRELATRWGVCIDKVLNFIRSGELRAFNVASKISKRPRYRISMAEVERFEQETRAAASPAQTPPEVPRRRNAVETRPAPKTYF
jgi:hypothetical protein